MVEIIPTYGLGTWKIAKDKSQEIVYSAIKDQGVRHIDCACDYGNEVEVGRGIAQAIAEGIVRREDLWITSKLWNTYHREEHVKAAFDRSLKDLGLTYLDLYLIHFPIALKYVPFETRYPPEWIHDPSASQPTIVLEPKAPLHKTWAAMETLVHSGLVRHIGVSNFNVQLLMDVLSYATIRPFCNQVEIHPYNTQESLREVCQRNEIRVVAYSPLASMSYVELGGDRGIRLFDEADIQKLAQKYNRTPAQIVLRWNVQLGNVIIPKASSNAHLAENVAIFDFSLTEDEMSQISALNRNLRFNDPGVYGRFMGLSLPIFA
eukprot:gene6828-7543_t